MESLHARKLSNANSFSGKNAYDGVFSGRQKYGAPVLSSNVEDYREIFGRSQASSIPVLNLSAFDESSVSSSFRSSKPDYSKIFGGFRADEDDSVFSYDELFGGAKNSSEKARTPPSTRPPLQNADKLCSQPSDGLKQFNMSYHKTPQKSKNGPDGTTHVAQLHAVPGFTCFIDETPLPPEMQSEKQKSSLANNLYSDVDCRNAVPTSKSTKKAVQDLPNKQSSGNIVKSGSRNNKNESSLDDKLVNEYEVDLKSHPRKVPSPPSEQFNLDNRDAYRERSMASNSRVSKSDTSENAHGKFSHPSSDDELDVNSAAAASVAALRKAIQKAQESIRIAKESVGRKKEGLRSFSNLSFKDSLKVEGKMDNLAACGGQNFKDNDAKEFEGVNAASEDFLKLERNYKHGNGVVYPGLKDREKLFVAKKVITEMHGKILESAKTCPIATSSSQINGNKIVSDSREATGDVDPKILESAEPVFYSGLGSMGRNATLIGKVDNKYNNRCTDEHEFKFVENRASNETLEQDVVLKSLESVEETSELEDHETKRDDGKIAQELEGEMEKQESAWFVHGDKHNGNLGAGKDYEPSNKKQNVIYAHENFVEKLQENEETMEDVSDVPIELEENSDKDTPSNTNNTVIDENSLNEFKRMASEEVVQDQSTETDFNEKKQNVVPEQEFVEVGNESGVANICNKEEHEKEFEEAFQQDVHENELNNDLVTNSNERREEESHKGEKNERRLDEVHELEINENRQANAHKIEGSEANLKEVYHLKQNYEHEGEEIVNRLDDVHETKINDNPTDASDMEGSEDSLEDKVDFSGDSAKVVEAKTYNISVSIPCESYESEEDMEMWASQEVVLKKSSDLDCDACSNYASDDETEPQEAWKEEADNKMGTSEEFDDNSESSIEDSGSLYEFKADDAEVTSVAHELERELFSQTAPKDQTATEDNEIKFVVNILFKGHHSDDNSENSCLAEADLGQREGEQSGLSSDSETAANGSKEDAENMEDRSSVGEEEEIILEDKFVVGGYKEEHNGERANEGTPLVEKPNGTEASHIHKDVDEKENAMDTNEEIKEGEYKEEKEELKETGLEEVRGKEYLRKIDEATEKEREREREREKVRLAVERAIREARERAFAEARERAERAAVEKATAEVRQRAMAGARIKLEKNSAATKSFAATKTSAEIKKPSDKDAVDAKLRAERAAVERATAEARERALKAMSQKSNSDTFKDTITTTSSSSDLHGSNGKVSELAQRSKEELEKHNRIMERTAKALAEKEKRDLLARKEQVEKNRLAETLDADIKRWSSGKEGNLRALLSTLQYILGPDSGWQPVTLTEIITTNAIKKAYRKATLCVHPDKLQQRGASIQQKYVCEKVFDLLKAAWNKFNAEER